MSKDTYKATFVCGNCPCVTMKTIPPGTTIAAFARENKKRECDNCGVYALVPKR